MPAVKFRDLTSEPTGEASAQIRERVILARRRQQERFRDKPKVTCNARMGSRELKQYCALDEATLEMLKSAMADLNLSARPYDRVLEVARSIADPPGCENIVGEHISEAIRYRSLDRQLWTSTDPGREAASAHASAVRNVESRDTTPMPYDPVVLRDLGTQVQLSKGRLSLSTPFRHCPADDLPLPRPDGLEIPVAQPDYLLSCPESFKVACQNPLFRQTKRTQRHFGPQGRFIWFRWQTIVWAGQ